MKIQKMMRFSIFYAKDLWMMLFMESTVSYKKMAFLVKYQFFFIKKACIFAYGQTSSGKTFTMKGMLYIKIQNEFFFF